jgi:geranylgeranyl diphosphate synthase type I
VERLRSVIVDTGALRAVEERIAGLHDEAVDALERAPVAGPVRGSLRELAERSVRRTR